MITPRTIYWSFGSLIIILVLLYLGVQVSAFALGPSLSVDLPESLITTEESIVIKGETSKNSRVLINNQEILVQESGNFQEVIYLQTGENILDFKSINHKNKTTHLERRILRK